MTTSTQTTKVQLKKLVPSIWPLYPTGLTSDGEILMGGLLTYEDTHGFPLDMAIEILEQQGRLVDYAELMADAGARGIKRYDSLMGQLKYILKENLPDIQSRFAMMYALESRRSGENDFQKVCEAILNRKYGNSLATLVFLKNVMEAQP